MVKRHLVTVLFLIVGLQLILREHVYMRPAVSVALFILAVSTPVQAQTAAPATKIDADGWTTFTPSADTRIVYVSNSTGSDIYAGSAEDKPVKTIAKGISRLRNGYPDWLLLKRGDTWYESIGWPNLSGRSASNPILLSSYGTGPRPVIKSGGKSGFAATGGRGVKAINNISLVGLDFYAQTRDPNSPEFAGAAGATGISWIINAANILIEDCVVRYYRNNIVMGESSLGLTLSNVSLRRNIIVDAYSTDSHSQGLYADGINMLMLEGNLFDHNGWNASVRGAEPTIFNHNIYIQTTNGPATLIRNISANASSHGAQVRSGGTITDNLFVHNPIGLLVGGSASTVNNNVITEGGDISPADPRGFGIDIDATVGGSVMVLNNIIANEASGSRYGHGIHLTQSTNGVTAINNLTYHWDHPIVDNGTHNVTSPNSIDLSGYPDPGRSVATYDAMLGGDRSLPGFLEEARKQDKDNWRPRFTADAINEYLRAGFGIVSSTAPKAGEETK
jgi:hypothetical protein